MGMHTYSMQKRLPQKVTFVNLWLCTHILWPWQSCFYVNDVETKLLSWHGHNNKLGPGLCLGWCIFMSLTKIPKTTSFELLISVIPRDKQFLIWLLTCCFFCFSRFQWILGRSFSTWAHGFVSTRGRCEKAQLRFVGCYVKTHHFRWWKGLGNLTVKHSQDSLQAFGIFECNMNYTGWQKRSIILTSAWLFFLCRGKHAWASRMARSAWFWFYFVQRYAWLSQ